MKKATPSSTFAVRPLTPTPAVARLLPLVGGELLRDLQLRMAGAAATDGVRGSAIVASFSPHFVHCQRCSPICAGWIFRRCIRSIFGWPKLAAEALDSRWRSTIGCRPATH